MTGKKLWMGMLAIMLVFGMTVISCEEPEENALYMFIFKTSEPSAEALAVGGEMTLNQFNQIKDAGGDEFLGWDIDKNKDEDEDLVMAWSGRSLSNFNSVADVLKELFDEDERGNTNGVHFAEGDNYTLLFYPSKFSGGWYFVPAGTLIAFIW